MSAYPSRADMLQDLHQCPLSPNSGPPEESPSQNCPTKVFNIDATASAGSSRQRNATKVSYAEGIKTRRAAYLKRRGSIDSPAPSGQLQKGI